MGWELVKDPFLSTKSYAFILSSIRQYDGILRCQLHQVRS